MSKCLYDVHASIQDIPLQPDSPEVQARIAEWKVKIVRHLQWYGSPMPCARFKIWSRPDYVTIRHAVNELVAEGTVVHDDESIQLIA